MKIRKKKKKRNSVRGLKLEVDVVVRFPDGDGRMDHPAAKVLEDCVKEALPYAFPGCNLRGLWVHEGRPRDEGGGWGSP